jgi:hypothetical protein
LGVAALGLGIRPTQLPFVAAAFAASALVLHLIPAMTARGQPQQDKRCNAA